MEWIDRKQIAKIAGARRADTYVARAYRYQLEHDGSPPDWAAMKDGGWRFDTDYIHSDARLNLESMGVSEAAGILGATRRAVQDWVDADIIPVLDSPTRPGERRHIDRSAFLKLLPQLKRRMETPAVIGKKLKSGKTVEPEVIERLRQEKECRAGRKRRARRRRIPAEDSAAALTDDQITARIDELSKVKKESGRTRRTAQKRLRSAESSEARAVRSLDRKASTLTEELKNIRQARHGAARERKDAARIERELAAKEKHVESEEKRLRSILKIRQREEREHEVAGIEARFAAAREARHHDEDDENRAVAIAARINNDLLDGNIDRIDAAMLFTQLAEESGIPAEIRVRIRKQVFGR